MLIESYLVEFSEIKNCITSMDSEDFVVMSKSIFFLDFTTDIRQHRFNP